MWGRDVRLATAQQMKSLKAHWLPSGASGLAAMRAEIEQASYSVKLQTYIFNDDDCGRRMRSALIEAAERGLRVHLLVDALGSVRLPAGFFDGLEAAGGKVRRFNPLKAGRLVFRNHRKLLVCDRERAIVGGFNIGDEYDGDGVEHGWADLGLALSGPLVDALAMAFDRMYQLASEPPPRLARLRVAHERRVKMTGHGHLLLGGPGRGPNPLKASLMDDLSRARSITVVSPYFLPPWRLRRRLVQRARQGGRVRLLLPARSDVQLALHASRALYSRLLEAGVEILEYQPQILHSKLVIADRHVYVGSANFNTRSLHIDYELLLRLSEPRLVQQAHGLVDAMAERAETIDARGWKARQGIWRRLRQHVAYFLLARVDPLVARWLWSRQAQ
ncbi:Phospholipase D/Transphosphatidylase [Wenzhouxiangella marina]|uniref:Phospholipase D/Transphosphatidylase n=2 Tax=Wenzhouxiangella marina TaxID=1579979 RepID=A0A0K0XXB8_9GAMM|nr:Phospholipase D/Transphosphatidylase [Wenzhouxiangella marina]